MSSADFSSARGAITSRRISITGELVELNELFTGYWRSIVPVARTSSIAFPFSRLHREPFWQLVPLPGHRIDRERRVAAQRGAGGRGGRGGAVCTAVCMPFL